MTQWLLSEKSDYPYAKIADILDLGCPRSVSWACAEVKKLVSSSPAVKKRLDQIERVIDQLEN